MTLGDHSDSLAVAREQLRAILRSGDALPQSPEFRVQLGLLAAQIAVAERLDNASPEAPEQRAEDQFWDLPRLVAVISKLAPKTRQFLQVLVDEGGAATPARLKELTGMKSTAGAVTSIRTAVSSVTRDSAVFPTPMLVQSERVDGHQTPIARYVLASDVLDLTRRGLAQVEAQRRERQAVLDQGS